MVALALMAAGLSATQAVKLIRDNRFVSSFFSFCLFCNRKLVPDGTCIFLVDCSKGCINRRQLNFLKDFKVSKKQKLVGGASKSKGKKAKGKKGEDECVIQ